MNTEKEISYEEMCRYGYTYDRMYPICKETALKLFSKVTIFALYSDETEAMIDTISDIEKHDGLFGVEAEDWINYKENVK